LYRLPLRQVHPGKERADFAVGNRANDPRDQNRHLATHDDNGITTSGAGAFDVDSSKKPSRKLKAARAIRPGSKSATRSRCQSIKYAV